nr:hypothetical protein CFP56_04046 [Quercus suber]
MYKFAEITYLLQRLLMLVQSWTMGRLGTCAQGKLGATNEAPTLLPTAQLQHIAQDYTIRHCAGGTKTHRRNRAGRGLGASYRIYFQYQQISVESTLSTRPQQDHPYTVELLDQESAGLIRSSLRASDS